MNTSRTGALQARAVGIPWYEAEDYPRVLAVMEDADRLPGTHASWKAQAEQIEDQLRRRGHLVVRAHLRPDDFVTWCAARGLHVNAQARTRFASLVAAQVHGKTH